MNERRRPADMALGMLNMDAIAEHRRLGRVESVRCDACGDLIHVEDIHNRGTAWRTSCPCGRCNDVWRGL